MKSPLVLRLEGALRGTDNPVLQAELLAKIACYQARVGEFEDARKIRDELRGNFGDGRSASVSILIMLLEALLLYFENLDSNSRDRLARANLISIAFQQRPHISLTSAWLAHVDFNHGRYESMAKEVAKCVDEIEFDDGDARCRVSLVLGDALLFADLPDESQRWYEHARIAANRLGDQAAIGAITYNRAALHTAAARIKKLTGLLNSSEISLIAAEVRSAVNYQATAQLKSLDHLLHTASIGVFMLEERYAEASSAILGLLATSNVPSGSAQLALLLADHSHCQARMGNMKLAEQMAGAVASATLSDFDADDRARIFAALEEFSIANGDAAAASIHAEAKRQALQEHGETVGALRKLLEPYAAGPKVVIGP